MAAVRRLLRSLLIALTVVVIIALVLIVVVIGLLALQDRQRQDDEAAARQTIQRAVLPGASLAYTLAYIRAHPRLSLPNHHFTQQYLNLPFERTARYDGFALSSEDYPKGKALVAGWSGASEGEATLDVVFFFDSKGRFTRCTIKEVLIQLP